MDDVQNNNQSPGTLDNTSEQQEIKQPLPDDVSKAKIEYRAKNFFEHNQAEHQTFNDYSTTHIHIHKYGKNDDSEEVQYSGAVSSDKVCVYDLSNPKDCQKFFNKYKDSVYCAYAIAMCVFRYIAISDTELIIRKLMEKLLFRFDKDDNLREDSDDPYIGVDTIIDTIGGTYFKTDDGKKYIGYQQEPDKVRENIWNQYPYFHSSITNWLIDIRTIYKISSSFEWMQIVQAFSGIISLDFEDGSKIFTRLLKEQINKYFVADIAVQLYSEESQRLNITYLLREWAGSYNWHWQVACVVYSRLDKNVSYSDVLENTFYTLFKQQKGSAEAFIGQMLYLSEMLRALTVRVLKKLIGAGSETAGISYMQLITNAYYSVSEKNVVLPLVTCDNADQQKGLKPILEIVLTQYNTRKLLFDILREYLLEISCYKLPDGLIGKLKGFFYTLSIASRRHTGDVTRLLNSSETYIAREIEDYLRSKTISAIKELQQ